MSKNIKPPKWVTRLLERFADDDTLEEVEGDLLEFYAQWVESKGRMRANLKYLLAVITLLRPLRRSSRESRSNMPAMIKSYFIMSYRTIVRNKVSSLINFAGLTLGLTTSLLILLVVLAEIDFNKVHLKKEVVFLMLKNQKTNDGISTGHSTPGPLSETLKANYSQVVHSTRAAMSWGVRVIADNKKFTESGLWVDSDLFRMMTYTPLHGDPAKAIDANEVVITESMAIKLFGKTNAIQESILFGSQAFSVGAVVKDMPQNSTAKFNLALPFKGFEVNNPWLTKWDDNRINCYVELSSANAVNEFNAQVAPLITNKTNDPNEWVFAYPLSRLHLYGDFSNGQPSGGLINIVWILIGFGCFMLMIACVNFMNIATAQAAHRAREVGVRKVLGAMRRWIALQFLSESMMITFISLIASIVLTILLIPSFNLMMHTAITFEISNLFLWALCVAVGIVTAVIAGSYPAFVLSRFSPARVLKGAVDRLKGSSLRRALVTFQFVISIFVLIGTIILYAQFDYVKHRPLGYEQENLVNIPLDSLAGAKFEIIKSEVSQIPGVAAVTGSAGNILYSSGAVTGMSWPGKKAGEDLSIVTADVGYDWTNTMGIEVTSGRDFSEQFATDENACLLNQSAVDKMGLVNPIGSIVGGHTVIGIFKDYVYNNPAGVVSPMIVFLNPTNVHQLYVRIQNDDSWMGTIANVEKVIKQVSPDIELTTRFTVDEYQSNFEEFVDVGVMISIFGGMTMFISCLGLFGLSGFIAERRSKEMSIRKVFGADSLRILWALSADILSPVAIALLIVVPIATYVGRIVLQQFVYRVQLHWSMFAEAALMVLAISTMIVLYHGRRTATENPSIRLKNE